MVIRRSVSIDDHASRPSRPRSRSFPRALNGTDSGAGRPNPMPERIGAPSTRSTPLRLLLEDQVDGLRRQQSDAVDSAPQARRDWIRAQRPRRCRDRWHAPMSAWRHCVGVRDADRVGAGPVNVLQRHDLPDGRAEARPIGTAAAAGPLRRCAVDSAGASTDLEVGPEWSGDLVARRNRFERRARDAAHDFADQVAVVQRVIARRRARLPPRRLGGEHGGRPLASRRCLRRRRAVPARTPDVWATADAGTRCPPCRSRRTPASTSATRPSGSISRGRRASARPARSRSWWTTTR